MDTVAKLRHVGIVTDRIEESIHFYSKALGFTVVSDMLETGSFIDAILGSKCKVRTVKMTNNNFMIEFLSFETFNSSYFDLFTLGCTHIAITVNCINDTFEILSKAGAEFISQPKISDDNKAKVCFCKDPNNNIFLEIDEQIH